MCYLITDNKHYIELVENRPAVTTDSMKAQTWTSESKAKNYMSTLPAFLNKFNWHVESEKRAVMSVNADIIDVDKVISYLVEASDRLERRLDYLYRKLSVTDLERTDIEHYVEFNEFDEDMSREVYERLHENALQRRRIKDEIAKTECLLRAGVNRQNMTKVAKRVDELQHKQYTARILSDIFKNEVKENEKEKH